MVTGNGHVSRVGVNSDAARPLLFQEDHTFGRADWPMDRFVFHVRGRQALGYSAYYNGLFDGYYRRISP